MEKWGAIVKVQDYITGIQHIGLPVKAMDETLSFYKGLGFEEAYSTMNGQSRVVFLKQKNLIFEIYEEDGACNKSGAIDHIAIDVENIENVFDIVATLGYKMLDEEIQYLPFWKNGVRFFTILGPNGEKIEFSQML